MGKDQAKNEKIKVAFLSTVAFDANVSLINALESFCDMYFITEACHEKFNHLKRDLLPKFVNRGDEVEQISIFSHLIPLDKTYVIKGCQQRFIFNKLWNSLRIQFLLMKINPEVVIIDGPGITYFFSVLFYRKRTLLLVHDPFLHSGGDFFIDRLLRKVFFRLIRKKILLNSSQKNQFINYYKQKRKDIYVSFLSIYKYLKCFANTQGIEPTDTFTILFFGGISEYKGLNYLLEAFLLIPDALRQNMQLIIAGGGSFDFSPYRTTKNISIINEFIQPEVLANYIRNADIVICPYTDATQSGVVMSAYAFHKPIIATNVGGLPEMVIDGKTGSIIEPKNAPALRDAIVSLYKDKDALEKMKSGIIETYEKGSKSWDNAAKLFMIAINDIIKENHS